MGGATARTGRRPGPGSQRRRCGPPARSGLRRMNAREARWTLAGVVLVGLGLRLLHLHAVAHVLLDSPPEVGMDRWLAMHVAQAVARGDWLGGWSADYDSTPGY